MLKLQYLFNNVNLAEMILRFTPESEKNMENMEAELEFIGYLRNKQYGVLESVVTKKGEELIEVRTPWGEYYASVFKRVSGVQLTETDCSDAVVFSHGKALGHLHQLSTKINGEQWDNEPDWLVNLRGRLANGLKNRAQPHNQFLTKTNEGKIGKRSS